MHKSPLAIALTTLLLAPAAWADALPLAQKGGCMACHTVDRKLVGPSYKEIATRYKGVPDAPAQLAERVRKGSTGIWGKVAMAPTPATRLGDEDLKTVIAWVLQQ